MRASTALFILVAGCTFGPRPAPDAVLSCGPEGDCPEGRACDDARNLCVDESRRAKFRRHPSLDAPRKGKDGDGTAMVSSIPANTVPTDEAAEAPTIRRRLGEAVANLPPEQREVFLLRQVSGLSFREIADTVGIPENTVKSRMRYALEKLRGELGDLRGSNGEAAGGGQNV